MDILNILKNRKKEIDEEIDLILPKHLTPESLMGASRHLVEAGGKRMRPVLTLKSAEAVGGDRNSALKSAAAIEILHTFTLVHDDIMDKDKERRGANTVHVAWDEPMAIIAGDALFAKVFEALSQNMREENIPVEKVIDTFESVSKASLKICQGQTLDMEFASREQVTEKEYLEMVEKKTGALIKAAAKVGAIIGNGSQEEIDALSEYGRLTGIAFQIHDDVLGAIGEQEKVGKPIGSDIKEGKWTLLAVHAYQEAKGEEKKELLNILNKDGASEKEIETVLEIYSNTGAVEFAKEKAKNLIEKAKSELDILSDSKAKNFLLELADFSVEREL